MDQYEYSASYDDPLLAELYDRFEAFEDDLSLLRSLIGSRQRLSILECFSGTGRILIPLAKDGHAVTGIELAWAMHQRAARKLKLLPTDVRSRARLEVRDALDGGWGSGYDLVILGANALYELPSASTQEQCIRLAAAALRLNGHVFVDNDDYKGDWERGPFGQQRIIFEGTGSDGTFGRFTLRHLRFDKEAQVLEVQRSWYKRDPSGTEEEQKYVGRKHPVRAQEVRDWLRTHGFRVLEQFGNREGVAYTPSCDRAIFWAQKQV
jgi:SAM-dependent methyltransferase